MIDTDVLIVGAGPAGSACAWRLKQLGVDCLMMDKASFPRCKRCAGWVNPELFPALGISPSEYPYTLSSYERFNFSVKGLNLTLKTQQYGIRRWDFDRWMVERSGVELVSHHVRKIEQISDRYVIDEQFRGKYLIGAGGTHCPVRRTLFSSQASPAPKGLIIAKEEEFQYPIRDMTCRVWFFEDGLSGYSWYFPKSDGYLNVGIGGSARGIKKSDKTLDNYWAAHIQRLAEIGLVTDHHYHPGGHSYFLRSGMLSPHHNQAYLVGDALGIATLDMGEGITPSVQSGILAAESIATGKSYKPKTIPRYSLPSILRLRWKNTERLNLAK